MKEIVVVTGASGFIGAATCERFAESFHVAGLDRPGLPHPPPSAEKIDLDLTSDESVRKAFAKIAADHGRRIASVIHLAAYYDFSGKPSDKYEEITVQGTRRLLGALQSFQVEQFIFSSTMLVHAPCAVDEKITELSPLDPKWDYPKSKVKTEKLIRSERGAIPAVLLRIAGVYDDTCHSIPLAHQIQRIYEQQYTSHLFPGDLSHGQSFLHVDDLIDALDLLVKNRKKLPQELSLLAGEPETLSYGELQKEFGRLIHGRKWETFRVPKIAAKLGAVVQNDPFIKPWMIDRADDHYELDISRAQSLLGWNPKRFLRVALPSMVSALKENPVEWYKKHNLTLPPRFEHMASCAHSG